MKEFIINEFKKYDWTVDYNINKTYEWEYEIKFPKCIISYYINKGYNSVECEITYNRKKYFLEYALRFNNKKTGYLFNNHSEVKVDEYIKQYTEVINTELLSSILYDFSWCGRANKSLGL